jgi:hypothetical protein
MINNRTSISWNGVQRMKSAAMALRLGLLIGAATLVTGCGLGEATVGAASNANAAVQEAKEGKRIEDQVKQRLDEAQQTGNAQREQAEKDAQ